MVTVHRFNPEVKLTFKHVTTSNEYTPIFSEADENKENVFNVYQEGLVAYKRTIDEKSHVTVFRIDKIYIQYDFADGSSKISADDLEDKDAYTMLKMYAEMRLADNELKRTPSKGLLHIESNEVLAMQTDFTKALYEAMDKKERNEMLKKALETLTDKQRIAIRLRFSMNLTQDQIAEHMGISRSSARDQVDGALKKLKKFIEKYRQNH